MNVLVLNCGSSSLKYCLITMPSEKELASGEAQRVGPPTAKPAKIFHRVDGKQQEVEVAMADHSAAYVEITKLLNQDSKLTVDVLGHRLVHSGDKFSGSALIDDDAIEKLWSVKDMSPIHNPPSIRLIEACRKIYPDLPQVAVFDTSFHSTIPSYAYTCALPEKLSKELGIRKYGFHGTSHQFVAAEAAKILGKPLSQLNAVSCHLGSGGASLCAIVNGRSVDNTMGYSPLQGLIMSTRCGDLDPAITLQLMYEQADDLDNVEKILNRESGVLGISGVSADIRDIFREVSANGNENSKLRKVADLYLWRIRKYLGSYLAIVGNPDAVIFTDTIGETMPAVRSALCIDMECFGMHLDQERNDSASKLPAVISTSESPVKLMVIKTNEELSIARETFALLDSNIESIRSQR